MWSTIYLICGTIQTKSLFQSVSQTDRPAPGAAVALRGGERQDHIPLPLRATQPGAGGKVVYMYLYIYIYVYIWMVYMVRYSIQDDLRMCVYLCVGMCVYTYEYIDVHDVCI